MAVLAMTAEKQRHAEPDTCCKELCSVSKLVGACLNHAGLRPYLHHANLVAASCEKARGC